MMTQIPPEKSWSPRSAVTPKFTGETTTFAQQLAKEEPIMSAQGRGTTEQWRIEYRCIHELTL